MRSGGGSVGDFDCVGRIRFRRFGLVTQESTLCLQIANVTVERDSAFAVRGVAGFFEPVEELLELQGHLASVVFAVGDSFAEAADTLSAGQFQVDLVQQ